MSIIKLPDFSKAFKKLPKGVQDLYHLQEKRFLVNPRDSRLHIKKLKGFDGVFSFRITRQYRVLFYFTNHSTAVFVNIGHRKDIY